jgi:hypothetical protein
LSNFELRTFALRSTPRTGTEAIVGSSPAHVTSALGPVAEAPN